MTGQQQKKGKLIMDYNKDLTMESDFIGMFDYPASRLNKHNNPVDPAAIQSAVNAYLKNNPGTNGKSAYEIAVENGYTGTEAEWLESLKGGNDPTDIDFTSNAPIEDDDPTTDINFNTFN